MDEYEIADMKRNFEKEYSKMNQFWIILEFFCSGLMGISIAINHSPLAIVSGIFFLKASYHNSKLAQDYHESKALMNILEKRIKKESKA